MTQTHVKSALQKPLKYCLLLILLLGIKFSAYSQMNEVRYLKARLPTITDSTQYVDALNRIGFMIHIQSADSCFYYGKKAQAIANRLHYVNGQAAALLDIAITLTLKGLYSQALDNYTKSYILFNKMGNYDECVQLLMDDAITYQYLGNKAMSVKFAKRGLHESYKVRSDSVLSSVLVNYANLDLSLSANDVESYVEKAEKIANKYKDARTLLYIKQVRAGKLLEKGKNEEARSLILQSIAMAKVNQWEYHEMEGLNLYAQYFLADKKTDSAINCYQTIYKMALKNGYGYWQTDVLQSLLSVYETKHDINAQLQTNKLLVSALQKNNDNNSTFVGDYIAYNTAQEDLSKYKIDFASKQLQTLWLTVLIIIIAAIAALLFRLYNNSRKYGRSLNLLNEKVNKQNDELHQADEFKNKLISMLAHDFRSPVASAINMMMIVRDGDDLEEYERDMLYDSIETDMRNILLTFDNILQWIKKQLSGFVYEPQQMSVHGLLDEAATMFKDTIEIKKINLTNNAPAELNITSDKEIIQFINRNLIHNAIKFSPQEGEIVLNARHVNNELIISVEDNGTGMSPQKLKTLFTYTNNKIDDNKQGAGIALTICWEFINKLNGRIWAESKETGGTIFYYALPVG